MINNLLQYIVHSKSWKGMFCHVVAGLGCPEILFITTDKNWKTGVWITPASESFPTSSKWGKILSMTHFLSYLGRSGKLMCNSLYSIQTLKYAVNSLFLLSYRNNIYTKTAHRKCCFKIFENILYSSGIFSLFLQKWVWLFSGWGWKVKTDTMRPNKHWSQKLLKILDAWTDHTPSEGKDNFVSICHWRLRDAVLQLSPCRLGGESRVLQITVKE